MRVCVCVHVCDWLVFVYTCICGYMYVCLCAYIYLYERMYICIHVYCHPQTVSLYHNTSVWLDAQDVLTWDRNLSIFTSAWRHYLTVSMWARKFYVLINANPHRRAQFARIVLHYASGVNSLVRVFNHRGSIYRFICICMCVYVCMCVWWVGVCAYMHMWI